MSNNDLIIPQKSPKIYDKLTRTQIDVYELLLEAHIQNGRFKPITLTNEQMTELVRCTKRTIVTALRVLSEHDLITVRYSGNGNQKRRIYVH